MRLALAQMNSVVGDLDGNRDRILGRLDEAKNAGADLVLFPELVVTGYPPEDLLLRPSFIRAAERTLNEIARATRNVVALVGGPLLARAPGFEECLLLVDVDPAEVVARRLRDVRRRALARERGIPHAAVVHVGSPRPSPNGKHVEPVIAEPLDDLEQMRLALELGLRDYVEKNDFSDVLVGVSGGIDSALVAALAVEALGPERCR